MSAIILDNPKYPHNVGGVVRAAACYGVSWVRITGDRVPLTPYEGYRLPREERMKGYRDVQLLRDDRPLDPERAFPYTGWPVIGVEIVPGATPLPVFPHPENAVYVFGPEDGSLSDGLRRMCHQFVVIPTTSCMNLASAVNVVLYDRMVKSGTWPSEMWLGPEYAQVLEEQMV